MKRIQLNNIGFLLTSGTSIASIILGVYCNFVLQMRFVGNSALIIALLLFLPRLLHRGTHLRTHITPNAVGFVECLVVLIVSLSGFGSFGFYQEFRFYDLFTHAVNPIFVGIGLSVMIASTLDMTQTASIALTQLWTSIFNGAIILLWELYEFGGDQLFGTHMLGQLGEIHDTLYDILVGVASLIIVYFFNRIYLSRLLLWLKQ